MSGAILASARARGREARAEGLASLDSYRLQLCPGQAFEIEDPADQVDFLADSRQAPAPEPPQAMPVFALAEQLLDLLPRALQAVAEPAHAHADARVRRAPVPDVHGDMRLNAALEQCLDEGLADEALVGSQRARREPQPAPRAAQQRQTAARLRRARAIDLRVEAEQHAMPVLH